MDISLALNDIEIRQGLKGYKRKSSAISQKADAEGLSAFFSRNMFYIVTDSVSLIKSLN